MGEAASSGGAGPASGGSPGAGGGVRATNRERILDLLRAQGPMTQADLARASGLSPATISSIARELREDGWLEPDDGDGRARGRALALSRSAGVAVGIDFGHSHVRVAVADLAHTVLAEAEEALDVDHEAHEGLALAGRLVQAEATRSISALDTSSWRAPVSAYTSASPPSARKRYTGRPSNIAMRT